MRNKVYHANTPLSPIKSSDFTILMHTMNAWAYEYAHINVSPLKSERWKNQGAQAKEGIHHGTQLSATAAEWASEYFIYKLHYTTQCFKIID